MLYAGAPLYSVLRKFSGIKRFKELYVEGKRKVISEPNQLYANMKLHA